MVVPSPLLHVTFSLFAGCLDKKRVCDPWARLGFCERRKTFMKKNCPQRCDLCYGETMWGPWWFWSDGTTTVTLTSCLPEPLDAVATPTPPPANVKIKMVPRGKVVGFRCGTKNPRSPPKVRSADQPFIFSFPHKPTLTS